MAIRPRIVVLLPAYNEQRNIAKAITTLQGQTVAPDRIIVIPNNCTDATAEIARHHGAEVRVMVDNKDKKAGALNWVLADILDDLAADDLIVVQDADSSLDPTFIEMALPYAVSKRFGAVGGVFRGEGGAGFVGHLQRNEYTRYARDVRNLGGRCLVVTGTASMFRVEVLREVVRGRRDGRLPAGDGSGGVYDTTVLTEDNEISFAIQTMGYELVSPEGCYLVTEIMASWTELWKQRLRWKRGAVENCFQYGMTKTTRSYWGRQGLAFVGMLIFTLYLTTLAVGAVTGSLHIQPFWLCITVVFMIERAVTIKDAGWKQMLLSLTMYEVVIDLFLQACHAKAFADSFLKSERKW